MSLPRAAFAVVLAVLLAPVSTAAAATGDAGPSATPLLVELGIAALVIAVLTARAPLARAVRAAIAGVLVATHAIARTAHAAAARRHAG
jgi:hypothetical protein